MNPSDAVAEPPAPPVMLISPFALAVRMLVSLLLGGAFLSTLAILLGFWDTPYKLSDTPRIWLTWLVFACYVTMAYSNLYIFSGPTVAREIVAYTRKGTYAAHRAGIAVAMLGGIYLLYATFFPGLAIASAPFESPDLSVRDQAKFGEAFINYGLGAQFLAMLVLTPLVMSDAIARDKETGQLDFALLTPLQDFQIVFDRYTARMLYLVPIIVGSVPILAAGQLFGGVQLMQVLAGTVSNLGIMASLGAACILASVRSRTVLRATLYGALIAECYGIWLPYTLHIATIADPEKLALHLFNPCMQGGCTAAVMLQIAARQLRPRYAEQRENSVATRVNHSEWIPWPSNMPGLFYLLEPSNPGQTATPLKEVRPARPRWPLPPLRGEPLLWKELSVRPALRWLQWRPGRWDLLVGFAVLFAAVGCWVARWDDSASQLALPTGMLAQVCSGLAFGLLGYALVYASNALVRERQRDTLDGLLMLPEGAAGVIDAKFRAALASVGLLHYVLLAISAIAALGGLIAADRVLLFVALYGLHASAFCTVGLLISARAKTGFRANLAAAGVLLALLYGQPLLRAVRIAGGMDPIAADRWLHANGIDWLFPRTAWDYLLTTPTALRAESPQRLAVLAGSALLYGLVTIVGQRWAARRLRV